MTPVHQLPAFKDKEIIKAGPYENRIKIFLKDEHEGRNMC